MSELRPRELRRARDAQSTSTRCIIEFFTWKENGFSGRTDTEAARQSVGSPIAVNYSKSFGQAAGSFTITMKRPQAVGSNRVTEFDYHKLWADPEGVWVLVQWLCDGTLIDGFFGSIDTINVNVSRTDQGARNETYEIHGRDFGKVFEDTIMFINPKSQFPVTSYSFLVDTLKGRFELSTPADFIKSLIEAWIGNSNGSQAWELPPGLKGKGDSFYQMLSFAGVQEMNRADHGCTSVPRLIDPDQDGSNLWDMLQHYSNGVLNELWFDLAPPPSQSNVHTHLVPTVFLRERPFPTQDNSGDFWKRVRTWRLDRGDIRERQLAKGGSAARFNYWLLYPGGFGMPELSAFMQRGAYDVDPGQPGSIPIVNLQSIRRYGLRKWEQSTIFAPANLSQDPTNDAAASVSEIPTDTWKKLVAAWLKKVHDWYVVTPRQLSGHITTTRMFPEIRLGQKLHESTDAGGGLYYYIEGVSHAWRYPGTGTSSFTVTRGEFGDDDHLGHVYGSYSGQDTTDAATSALSAAAKTVKDVLDTEGNDPAMIDKVD